MSPCIHACFVYTLQRLLVDKVHSSRFLLNYKRSWKSLKISGMIFCHWIAQYLFLISYFIIIILHAIGWQYQCVNTQRIIMMLNLVLNYVNVKDSLPKEEMKKLTHSECKRYIKYTWLTGTWMYIYHHSKYILK